MLVLDHTALGALVDGHPRAIDLWNEADQGRVTLGFPATVIVEVGRRHGMRGSAWDALLWPPRIEVLPLVAENSAEIGTWSGDLHVRHALWEARHIGWPVLTLDRDLYGPGDDVVIL